MEAKKVLFINQEIIPYVPESEMSHLGRLIPQVIQDKGYEIRTFMPKWGNICLLYTSPSPRDTR